MKQSLPTESERQQANYSHHSTNKVSPVSQVFVDSRESTVVQRQLMTEMANSPQAIAQRQFSEQIHSSPRMTTQRRQMAKALGGAVQCVESEEELLQGKFRPIQRVEEEALLQGKFSTMQLAQSPEEKRNNTGLPDNLKQGIENLSGMSMDNVKVHYNSPKPAQLNALAYAQGTDIHLGAGQEKHLPHEAWHVVQQAQGRVKPTMQMREGVPVNDDQALEQEADVMGAKAVSFGVMQAKTGSSNSIGFDHIGFPIQRYDCVATTRLADNKIGRAHNAGIVDEEVTLATGLKFTQHFHCNGWTEKDRNFTSFTGTFIVDDVRYHYTIVDGGDAGWVGKEGKPDQGAMAMKIRTEDKLSALID